MYLYYDKTKTLKTAISHGETIRQNSDANVFVCLDRDFFEQYVHDDDLISSSFITCSVTYENGKFGADNISSISTKQLPFRKLNSSEITYYLQNNKYYWIYHVKFDYSQISLYPGKIYFNVNLNYNDVEYPFAVAELYVEERTGLPASKITITETQYNNVLNQINELKQKIKILEESLSNSSGDNGNFVKALENNYDFGLQLDKIFDLITKDPKTNSIFMNYSDWENNENGEQEIVYDWQKLGDFVHDVKDNTIITFTSDFVDSEKMFLYVDLEETNEEEDFKKISFICLSTYWYLPITVRIKMNNFSQAKEEERNCEFLFELATDEVQIASKEYVKEYVSESLENLINMKFGGQ